MRSAAYVSMLALLAAACTQSGPRPTPAAGTDAAAATESARLNAWLDERFEEKLMMSPSWLARLARKERYDEYDDLSEAEADRQLAWLEVTAEEMKERFSYDALDAEARTSWDLWLHQVEQARRASAFRRHRYLFTQMHGPQTSLAQFLIRFHRVDDAGDMEAYAKRIGGIARALRQLVERAQLGAAEGVRPPRFAYDGATLQSENFVRGAPFDPEAEDSPLWRDAKEKIAALEAEGAIDAARAEALREATRRALVEDLLPAYQELIAWLRADRESAEASARGVYALPGGAEYYQQRLEASTTTKLTADEVHEIGLAEVARIRGEMEAIRREVGFDGDLQAFFDHLESDPRFLYPNTDEGRAGYLRDSEAHLAFIDARLPDYFGLLPRAALVVKRVEAFREQDGAPQHYSPGAPDGSRPGVYYAHLSDMSSMPKHLLEAIAYHEGNPGHHMQISIAQELTEVPEFRTQARATAFVEGWGLYAEWLAKEMGAYADPYSDFGRLSTEMWRAIRLVLDTGIHARGWTEEQAIAYFRENSAVADGAIEAEVRRYFVWPGQATAYKIGMLRIQTLRQRAEAALGERFDVRAFHDTILGGGALPLDILERRVDEWIAAQE